jgi:hypothetical protein
MRFAHRPLRTLLVAITATAMASTTVAAQVSVSFYSSVPNATDPNAPFNSASLFCSAVGVGTATGFSLDFGDLSTGQSLCPSNASQVTPFVSFAARFRGSLFAAAAGNYAFTLNTDDGEALGVNGVTISNNWFNKGDGPGSIVIALQAGDNPFVLDYYNGPCCGAFATFTTSSADVRFDPPVTATPEPSSMALMATGMLGMVGVAQRRRRRA